MALSTELRNLIAKTFANDQQKAYGQIATTSANQPSVRTVHIHFISKPEELLVISSNIQSTKWKNLETNPNIAGCFWNPENQIQFRFEGKAELIKANHPQFSQLVQSMWMKMREQVRVTYLLDEKGQDLYAKKINVDPKQHSKNHGLILVRVNVWDVFQNDTKEYRFGKRAIYTQKNGKWQKRDVNSLHSL